MLKRTARISACTGLAVLLAAVGLPTAAHAAEWTPTTIDELQTAMTTCADGDLVTVGANIGDEVTPAFSEVTCDVTLDLAGFTVFADEVLLVPDNDLVIADSVGGGALDATRGGIRVHNGSALTITGGTITAVGDDTGIGGEDQEPGNDHSVGDITIEGGTVNATGTSVGAGIGSGLEGTLNGTITISGGTVHASGNGGAGIGTGVSHHGGGSVVITGGDVTATSGEGAGIGGGHFGDGLDVTVSGGNVTAIGGAGSAGIGGSVIPVGATSGGNGGSLAITGGVVVATGDSTAVGAGENGTDFGSLTLSGDGRLSVPSGSLVIPDSNLGGAEVVIDPGAVLLGDLDTPTTGATITGAGQVLNAGAIALDESLVGVTVLVHNYLVTFDPQNGDPTTAIRVFAASFDQGFRKVPAPPDGMAWSTTPDTSGQPFDRNTALLGDLTVYAVDGPYFALSRALVECADGSTVVVPSDLSGGELVVGCDVTLDLNGHLLEPTNVVVIESNSLTVDDTVGGGELAATGQLAGKAGIQVPPGSGFVVLAGNVSVTGGDGAAGIGGNHGQTAGDIAIDGGLVDARGGPGAAAIGGGFQGGGGTVAIGVGAVVTTAGGFNTVGAGDEASVFGSLSIAGILRVGDRLLIPDSNAGGPEVVIEPGGQLLGPVEDSVFTGNVLGEGQIDNHGVISFHESVIAPTITITDHNYLVEFLGDGFPQAERVFATDFASGYRVVPPPPIGTDWNSEPDGSGTWFTAVTPLTGDLTVYAVPNLTLTLNPIDGTGVAGEPVAFEVTITDQNGTPFIPIGVILTSSNPGDTIEDLEVTGTEAGTRTITAALGPSTTATTLTILAAPAASLILTAPATSVAQGGSLTFAVAGTDAFGNPADVSGVVLTSSVATDVIDGLTVTFPHASPHVITASLGEASTSVTIEVVPAAVPPDDDSDTGSLSGTGANAAPVLSAGILLLLLGAALLLTRRLAMGRRPR